MEMKINMRPFSERIENPQFLCEGRLKPRATVVPAQREGIYFKNKEKSGMIQILNGDFKFSYQKSDCLNDFYEIYYDDTDWNMIPVPSMWQYEGYSNPLYPNVQYPFPVNPPYICCENPVGYYRNRFVSKKTAKTILYFGGVDSAFEVYLNGVYVGFSKGSRLPAEFDVTEILNDGENLLAVKVFTYSEASYLENQDMLLASGIFRDVMLYHLDEAYIWDYHIHTENNSIFVDVMPEGNFSGCDIEAEVCGVQMKKPAEDKVSFEFLIDNPKRWNAEEPNLYNVTLRLYKGETLIEVHSKRIGFMESKTCGNMLLVNERQVTIKGINRHEHNPKSGRTISVSQIEDELKLIKAHNMNAIRCSHYTNHPAFYEIASELGIYVMDEADLETHGCEQTGDQGYISKKSEWFPAYFDRISRMLERDKNETCIFIWSVGNEHGRGENLDKCIEYIRSSPYKKPVVHVCDNPQKPEVCDFRFDGYFNMESLTSFPEEGEPVILIEYGHAMGNSPGLMEDTWDYVYTHRHIAGGFVWEFKNHGFYKDADGKASYLYGGDFGDINHWSNFSMDGYCLSDGTPKPSFADCKNVLAPTYVTCDGEKIYITNTNDFKSLDYVTMAWELSEDYKIIRSGKQNLPAIKPYEKWLVDIDTSVSSPVAGAKYMVNLHFFDDSGCEIAFKQALLDTFKQKEKYESVPGKITAKTEGRNIEIFGEGFSVTFSDGLLCRYEKDGNLLIGSKMKMSFYRAPTDNDGIVNFSPRLIEVWDWCFLKDMDFFAEEAEVLKKDTSVEVKVMGKVMPTGRYLGFETVITYRVFADGLVLVDITGNPYGRLPEVLPRIGVCFELQKEFGYASWYGRGADENYVDRKAHCNLGYYQLPVDEMNFIYDVPQECGTRIDTHFVTVGNKKHRISVVGADSFSFSYHDFSLESLVKARHRNELEKSDKNYLYIDYAMRGLGSNSCGPNPEEKYELHPHTFRFVFALTGETDADKILNLSRKDFGQKTEKLSDSFVWKPEETEKTVIECDVDRN